MEATSPRSPDALASGGKTYADIIAHMSRYSDRGYTFLSTDGQERFISFAEVAREADRRARHFYARGLKPGDRMALIIPEGDEFVLSFLACLYAGIVPVPLYPPVAFGKLDAYIKSTAEILRVADVKMLLTTQRAQNVLWSLLDHVPSLKGLTIVEDLSGPGTGPAPDLSRYTVDDPAFIQFTSGSTSTPKGVMVPHRSILANAQGIMEHTLESNWDDRGVSWLPLYHDMGLIGFVLAPLRYAVPVYFIPTLSFVRRPALWLESIHKFRGTITFAPNFAFALAARRANEELLKSLDLSCLKVVGCGAEPIHGDTMRAFITRLMEAGLKPETVLPAYGMAEATLAMSFPGLRELVSSDWIDSDAYHAEGRAVPVNVNDSAGEDGRAGDGKTAGHEGTDGAAAAGSEGDADEKSGAGVLEFVSCGKPIPGHTVEIRDPEGQLLPERRVGEIYFSGPSVTAGYFNNSDGTRAAFTSVGLKTGDLGYLAEGNLYITGRLKDLIILNGRNYDPQSIEWEVGELEGVRKGNVVAFARPGANSEELVIVAETKEDPTTQEKLKLAISQRVQGQLALHVSDVVLLEPGSLPKTTSGKLQRSRTRQQYLDGSLGSEGTRTMGNKGSTFVVARHVARSLLSRFKHEVKSRVGGN